jgi:predicted branched-subunit amino acid permease
MALPLPAFGAASQRCLSSLAAVSGGAVMGVAYKGAGLGFFHSVLFSVVVYSATAQAVTLGMWAVPVPTVAMIIACLTK